MRNSSFRVLAALFVFCLSTTFAKADTYSFTNVGTTNNHFWAAANDYGDYVVYSGYSLGVGPCGVDTGCYALHQAFSNTTSYYTFLPLLPVAPNPIAGPGCTYNLANAPGAQVTCVNGHQYLNGLVNDTLGLFAWDGFQLNRIYNNALASAPLVTPNGNVFFYDGYTENLIAGIDLTTAPAAVAFSVTPEPSSLLLLGTGAIGVFMRMRRRGRV